MMPGIPRLSDEHVAGVALLGNNVEIAYALLAPARAADGDVQSYAARMRTDHTSLNAQLTDLLSRIDLEAQDDPAGRALRDVSLARHARLQRLTGRAFDAAYLDDDVLSHRELLDVIDRVLTPNARHRELREYLAALRPAVAAHLANAEQLRATLAARRP
jgi:putative membrane protein